MWVCGCDLCCRACAGAESWPIQAQVPRCPRRLPPVWRPHLFLPPACLTPVTSHHGLDLAVCRQRPLLLVRCQQEHVWAVLLLPQLGAHCKAACSMRAMLWRRGQQARVASVHGPWVNRGVVESACAPCGTCATCARTAGAPCGTCAACTGTAGACCGTHAACTGSAGAPCSLCTGSASATTRPPPCKCYDDRKSTFDVRDGY